MCLGTKLSCRTLRGRERGTLRAQGRKRSGNQSSRLALGTHTGEKDPISFGSENQRDLTSQALITGGA